MAAREHKTSLGESEGFIELLRKLTNERDLSDLHTRDIPPFLSLSYVEDADLAGQNDASDTRMGGIAAAHEAMSREQVHEARFNARDLEGSANRPIDTSFRGAHEHMRALASRHPVAGPAADALDIDILRDVIDPAADDLRRHPLPAVVLHKPFEDPGFLGASGGSASTCTVPITEVDRMIELLYGLCRYDEAGCEFLHDVLLTIYNRKTDTRKDKKWDAQSELDFREVMRLMKFKMDRANSSHQRVLDIVNVLVALQSRQGTAINVMEREKHSTFGRFFTAPAQLRLMARRLREKGRLDAERDVYVDFSCGTNEFGAMLGLKKWFGLDIYLPATNNCGQRFRWKNWFDVTWLPRDCVIGLNPPFGSKGELAQKFIDHALSFKPRLLVLIVPDISVKWLVVRSNEWLTKYRRAAGRNPKIGEWKPSPQQPRHPLLERGGDGVPLPPDYLLIDYDAHVTAGESFYMPSSVPSERSLNKAQHRAPSKADWSGDLSFGSGAGAGSTSSATSSTMEERGIAIKPDVSA